MKQLLLIVVVAVTASRAWAQPTTGSGAPQPDTNTPQGAGSGTIIPPPGEPPGGAAPSPSQPAVEPGSPAGQPTPPPVAPQPTGTGEPPPAPQPAGPPPEYPLEAGAVETKTGPCSNLKTKPWYEQLACKPHQDHEGNYWLPKSVNKHGEDVDTMYIATVALSAFFFIAITACVVIFCIKYRGRPGHRALPSPSHNDALEITWTVIPTIITVFLFYYGWRGYIYMQTPPVKAVEINVVAQKWSWSFTHSNGVSDSNLHVPEATPVRLVMTSKDVLHSFYVPSLRTKQDVIPRRYTYVWFEAQTPGTYRLYCTEFCGRDHSQMKVKVVVHKGRLYERYLAEKAEADQSKPLPELGAELYEKKACNTCHSLDGSTRVGPSFKGVFGTTIQLVQGSQTVDEAYIRESLMAPQAKQRPGFPPSMPSFEGQLKERQIQALVEFIKAQK